MTPRALGGGVRPGAALSKHEFLDGAAVGAFRLRFKKGDKVSGLTGLQDYVLIAAKEPRSFRKAPLHPLPLREPTSSVSSASMASPPISASSKSASRNPAKPSSYPRPLAPLAALPARSAKFTAVALWVSPAATTNANGSRTSSVSTPPLTTSTPIGSSSSPPPLLTALTSILKMSVGKSCKPCSTA